jgi:glycosyltransferase involved in cell wall biosynthesis
VAKVPEADGRVRVIDCGVDLERFRNRNAAEAEAFGRLREGSLAFLGAGPKRTELEARPGVRVVGRVPHERVADWIAACDVLCQPSLVEPFGQALLEAMASERSVLATRVGGPPEFVTPEAGIVVNPTDLDAIEAGLRVAVTLPAPNPHAREAAAEHDVRRQAERVSAVLETAAQ